MPSVAAEWTAASWQDFLRDHADEDAEAQRIRRSTHTERPLGASQFVREMERRLQRILAHARAGDLRTTLTIPLNNHSNSPRSIEPLRSVTGF